MSPILLIGIIVAVLLAAVGYAFVFQTLDNKRKQRQRVVTALKQRANNFAYMIHGFPQNFLTKDLTLLVHRCLIDVNEQLTKLDPADQSYIIALEKYREAMLQAQAQSDNSQRVQLQNPQQAKELRTHLEELHKFVEKLLRKRSLDGSQAKAYSKQIQKLTLQVSIDAHLMGAKQAQQGGKNRLAVHHYNLARKILVGGNNDKTYVNHIAQIDGVIQELENQLAQETQTQKTEEVGSDTTASKEWDEFENDETDWKKKTVYD